MMEQVASFFVSNAYADTSAVSPQGGGISMMVMFAIFFIFAYFAIWRPQSKRAKEQQALLSSLTKGDEVVTVGGVLGRISKINEQYITLSVGTNNVEIVMQKSSVATVLPKGTLKSIE